MTKQDKENLQNKKLTDSLLFSCLAACESLISKNEYPEKLSVSTITIIVNKDKGEQNNGQRNSNTKHTN